MVSRVFRERELRWVRTAVEAFEAAQGALPAAAADPAQAARHQLVVERISGLTELARVGAHLLEANHGPKFWGWVQTLVGDPRKSRAWLRRYGAELHAVG
jgi:hypothetical protein